MPQLFTRMRNPSDGARHCKQHQFVAGRQTQRMYQHRERVVDIDEFAGRFGDALRNFPGEFLRRARARQSFQQYVCARIAVLVDAVTEARETRSLMTGATSPSTSVFTSCAASTPAPPCFGPFNATRPAMTAS